MAANKRLYSTGIAVFILVVMLVFYLRVDDQSLSQGPLTILPQERALPVPNSANQDFPAIDNQSQKKQKQLVGLDDETLELMKNAPGTKTPATPQPKPVSDAMLARALEHLPSAYHAILTSGGYVDSQATESYLAFKQQQAELLDNYNTERLLSNFITQHEMGNMIELDDVTCAGMNCEIRGTQIDSIAWSTIVHEMQQQNWYTFSNEHHFQGYNESGQQVFLSLISP